METAAAPASAQVYRPRHPERTVLYRALAHHFERFLLVYEERFQASHGYLRRCAEPAVHRYLDCGIFDHGVARVRCADCRHEFLVAAPRRQDDDGVTREASTETHRQTLRRHDPRRLAIGNS